MDGWLAILRLLAGRHESGRYAEMLTQAAATPQSAGAWRAFLAQACLELQGMGQGDAAIRWALNAPLHLPQQNSAAQIRDRGFILAALITTGEDDDPALDACLNFSRMHPKTPAAWRVALRALSKAGRREEEVQCCRKALLHLQGQRARFDFLLLLADTLPSPDEALQAAEEAVEEADTAVRKARARALCIALHKAIGEDEAPLCELALAELEDAEGQFANGCRFLLRCMQAMALDTDDTEPAEAVRRMGEVLLNVQKPLTMPPELPSVPCLALHGFGNRCAQAGAPERFQAAAQHLAPLLPPSDRLSVLALSAFMQGLPEDAGKHLTESLRITPNHQPSLQMQRFLAHWSSARSAA